MAAGRLRVILGVAWFAGVNGDMANDLARFIKQRHVDIALVAGAAFFREQTLDIAGDKGWLAGIGQLATVPGKIVLSCGFGLAVFPGGDPARPSGRGVQTARDKGSVRFQQGSETAHQSHQHFVAVVCSAGFKKGWNLSQTGLALVGVLGGVVRLQSLWPLHN